MLDIVICSKNNDLMERSIEVINATLINYEIDYRIHKFKSCNKTLNCFINRYGSKIYILDMSIALDIAALIRTNDFESVIIFVSSEGVFNKDDLSYGFMALDYLCFDSKYIDGLKRSLNLGIKFIYRGAVLRFRYNYVTYQIPCFSITYIEKEPYVKRCIIHTLNGSYYVVDSIEKLSQKLGIFFVRSHQACIINISNVMYVDYTSNVIRFNNGDETTFLANKKKLMIKHLIEGDN